MKWTPTANHSPLNTSGGDLPHAQETRNQMGVMHPYPNFSNNDASQSGPNGYSPLSSPRDSFLEDTGTSKTI